MIKVALVGAGKMGISHLSILGAHPAVEVVGVADNTKLITDFLGKYSSFPCFDDYNKMLEITQPDAVVVAVPTRFHSLFVWNILNQNRHVFVEKPFCLDFEEGEKLASMAKNKKLINQVGYHNKFVATFQKAKALIDEGILGDIQHFSANMNGPVVTKSKQNNWRSKTEEGGGCLYDYAAHSIDLIHYLIGPTNAVKGVILKNYYSSKVEDGVYALIETDNNKTGTLSVNWSDDSYRKMSTELTIIGKKGKIIVDSTELKIYLKESSRNFEKGWTIVPISKLTEDIHYYLRGEEYSAQMDYFIKSIQGIVPNSINNFESAAKTDKAIHLIKNFNI